MSKAKTHQGTAKRIGITARGKLMRGRQMAGHLRVVKSPKRRRSLKREVAVHGDIRGKIEALLPYR